jgi:hypothetical protein
VAAGGAGPDGCYSPGEELLNLPGTCDRSTRRHVLEWLRTSVAAPSGLRRSHGGSCLGKVDGCITVPCMPVGHWSWLMFSARHAASGARVKHLRCRPALYDRSCCSRCRKLGQQPEWQAAQPDPQAAQQEVRTCAKLATPAFDLAVVLSRAVMSSVSRP